MQHAPGELCKYLVTRAACCCLLCVVSPQLWSSLRSAFASSIHDAAAKTLLLAVSNPHGSVLKYSG